MQLTLFWGYDKIIHYAMDTTETMQKYELLALLPLTNTDEELKGQMQKLEERLKIAGAVVSGNCFIQKGRLEYPIKNIRQGYYHTIQFEAAPAILRELRRDLTLSGDVLRFTISHILGAFKQFTPSAPRMAASPRSRQVKIVAPPVAPLPASPPPQAPVQETVKAEESPKVTMEEIDKRLEEILGE